MCHTKRIEEQELVRRLQLRDQAAASVLYEYYAPALLGVITRIVRSEQTAEDVMQECFIKVWASVGSYDSMKGRLFTWLINIARHAAVDAVRSPHYRNSQHALEVKEEMSSCPPCSTDGMDAELLARTLRPEYREVIDLLYFGGYSHKEAAEKLSLPLGTVKTRARKAILQLRILFNPVPSTFPFQPASGKEDCKAGLLNSRSCFTRK
ncbi:RNA polymerase sigma factor [Pontibacter toksunensis]|uniref:RNA polymerase sigma factor n=1 Tax=Pontibacter toksunensis TaxID=1332631 RepID=A0ABW6C4V3_9BACT